MNLRRVFVLFGKEIIQGPKNFMFVLALVVPVVLTLMLSLVFGTYFSNASRLGIVDQGSSQFPVMAGENDALRIKTYDTAEVMQDEVARGALDMGLVLPTDFDQQLLDNEQATVKVYVWGESPMNNRVIISSAIVHIMRQITGQELPVEIEQVVLGNTSNIPWEKRLLPLLVLMAVLLSGTMIPASSLVYEKTRRTLSALNVSPATLPEVYTAKGMLGVLLSMITATLILFLNRAFGGQPGLLLLTLLLGSIFSAALGVMLGALVRDINTLFATIKSLGIVLYAPGIISMFPTLPQWLSYFFPTYYAIQPILDITQKDAGFTDIWWYLAILVVLTLGVLVLIGNISQKQKEALAAV